MKLNNTILQAFMVLLAVTQIKAKKLSFEQEEIERFLDSIEEGDLDAEVEEEDGRELGYSYVSDDGMGFFNYQDDTDWSESAIMPTKCFTQKNQEYIVFNMYNKNHNQCARKKKGTYKMELNYFVKAYSKQLAQDSARSGNGGYEPDEEIMQFLYCNPYYYNNAYFYLKIGCRESTGKGFQLKAYSDSACTTAMTSQYNLGLDLSTIRVNFDTCKSCVGTSTYNGGYNGYNGDAYNNYYAKNYHNKDYVYYKHESPVCSAAWNYKSSCNWGCSKGSKNSKSSSGSSSGSAISYHDSFSPMGKVFLWLLTLNAFVFLFAALALRKRQSKAEILLEETAIRSAGIKKSHIPRIILAVVVFILCLILFRRKILTWFFLCSANLAAMGYYFHLSKKKSVQSDAAYNAYNENMS